MAIPASSGVCIVGGGPAGLAAAIALSQSGFETAVLECATPPIDKACGEGLMPDGLAVLNELGITFPAGVGYPFAGIRFHGEHSSVVARFPTGDALGLRRTILHSQLIRRAQELGVSLNWGVKNVHLTKTGVSVDDRLLSAKFVVAADGQNSQIRREAGLDRAAGTRPRYGFRRHYQVAPWSSYVDLYWGPVCQLYVTPVAADEVCVAVISKDPRLRLDYALTHFPAIRARLLNAPAVSNERGALSISRTFTRVANERVALVGDASGSIDAVTGEGLSLVFRQALALADALRCGDLQLYQVEHRRLIRRPRTMASLMLTLDAHPSFQRRALASLAHRPAVFERLLAVHVGAKSFSDLLSWDLFNLCFTFLSA